MLKKSLTLAAAALAFAGAAAFAEPLHNFGALHVGGTFPDDPDFGDAYNMGFCGSLDYGTRLGKEARWFAYGTVGYDTFRGKGENADTYIGNVNADARWYFGEAGEAASGYVGLGPGFYWSKGGDSGLGGNLAVGGDFPLGSDWSIQADIDQHFINVKESSMFLTVRVGAAYWFN